MPAEAKKAAMLGRRLERMLPLGRRTGGHFMPPVLEPGPGLESEQGWASSIATRGAVCQEGEAGAAPSSSSEHGDH